MSDRETKKSNGLDKTTRLFFYLCIAFCLSFIAWASWAPLDIVSDAVGEVIPSSRVKRVQHLEGGIVRAILVREGDSVDAGQPLIELEATASDSTVEELKVRISSLKLRTARLEAESLWFATDAEDNIIQPHSVPFVVPTELEEISKSMLEQAKSLYEARRERVVNDISAQLEQIKQRQQDIQEITARIRNQKQNLEYVQEQIAISEELLKDKLTTRYKHLGFLKEESTLISKIEEDNAALKRKRSLLTSARQELEQIANSFQEEVQGELRQTRRELLELSQRLRKMEDNLERTIVRSPSNGIIKTIYITGEQEVVQAGMTILDIVPADDKLVIEVHLPLGDIGYVHVGQNATVRLTTGDARMFGSLNAKVKRISPDAITNAENETYYRVLVETEQDSFEKGGRSYQLYPGMRLLVGIKTGERTVMEYLLHPYWESLSHGLQER